MYYIEMRCTLTHLAHSIAKTSRKSKTYVRSLARYRYVQEEWIRMQQRDIRMYEFPSYNFNFDDKIKKTSDYGYTNQNMMLKN